MVRQRRARDGFACLVHKALERPIMIREPTLLYRRGGLRKGNSESGPVR